MVLYNEQYRGLLWSPCFIKGKVHPCTGTEALYKPYGP